MAFKTLVLRRSTAQTGITNPILLRSIQYGKLLKHHAYKTYLRE
jgi:hypothetical protein